ncbi:hypothetical protein [Perlucidibaca aquatica]|uniref:hypothetical protein n=1 Tax=Perlucidibaca aquatica TaxID=1852776 RepID=UPI000839F9D8|nr:hypothetical protein [Perlucidibaca aquatica]
MNIGQTQNSSLSFYKAFQRCMEQRQVGPAQIEFLVVPAIVSAAFSVELGMKTLLLRRDDTFKSHNLEKLFGKLNGSEQAALIAAVGFTDVDFKRELATVANAFEEWRYIYEQSAASVNLDFLQKLATAVQGLL